MSIVFETLLAIVLSSTPYINRGLTMYPLKYVNRSCRATSDPSDLLLVQIALVVRSFAVHSARSGL